MTTVALSLGGMSCAHCARAVRDTLSRLPGVTPQSVTLGAATVDYDPAATSLEAISEAIREAGYPVLGHHDPAA
jgi:copper chaperone CopZ